MRNKNEKCTKETVEKNSRLFFIFLTIPTKNKKIIASSLMSFIIKNILTETVNSNVVFTYSR